VLDQIAQRITIDDINRKSTIFEQHYLQQINEAETVRWNIQNFRIRLIPSRMVLIAVTDGMVFKLDAATAILQLLFHERGCWLGLILFNATVNFASAATQTIV